MGCWVDGSISGMARELKRRCKGAERAGAGSLERICGMAMMLEGHRA